MWEGNEVLLNIINKSIDAIDDNQRQGLILSALADIKRVGLKEIVRDYGGIISALGLLIIVVLSYTIHLKTLANKRLNIEIAKVKEQEEKIRYISFHDSLTGLYNRAYLKDELKRIDTPAVAYFHDSCRCKWVKNGQRYFWS